MKRKSDMNILKLQNFARPRLKLQNISKSLRSIHACESTGNDSINRSKLHTMTRKGGEGDTNTCKKLDT